MERTNFGHAATLILKATKISKQCLCEYCMKLKSLRYRQVKQGRKRWGKKKERKWNRKRERKELGLDRKERNLYNRKLIHVSFSSIINFLNVTKKKNVMAISVVQSLLTLFPLPEVLSPIPNPCLSLTISLRPT